MWLDESLGYYTYYENDRLVCFFSLGVLKPFIFILYTKINTFLYSYYKEIIEIIKIAIKDLLYVINSNLKNKSKNII